MLFDRPLGRALSARSLGNLYAWLAGTISPAWLQAASPWVFMAIGICLAIGFFTRIASVAGAVFTFIGYFPSVNLGAFTVTQLINDSVIVLLCLFIIFFSGAGEYFGMDRFIHIHLGGKQKNLK